MPDEPETHGLLALMMIHHARRRARFSGEDFVLLDDRDRSLWDMRQIAAGRAVLDRAIALGGRGAYVVQAAIASLQTRERIDRPQVAEMYRVRPARPRRRAGTRGVRPPVRLRRPPRRPHRPRRVAAAPHPWRNPCAPATVAIPGYLAGTWKADPVHSEIAFSVRHLMVSKARGRFTSYDVTIVTSEDPLASTVTATIDLASIDTGNEQRDDHLRPRY